MPGAVPQSVEIWFRSSKEQSSSLFFTLQHQSPVQRDHFFPTQRATCLIHKKHPGADLPADRLQARASLLVSVLSQCPCGSSVGWVFFCF